MRKHRTAARVNRLIIALIAILLVSCSPESYTTHFRGYADIDDIRMYYEVHGEGEAILLLHGGAGHGQRDWSKVIPILAPQYQLIVPDSRAQGRSTDSDKPLGYDLLADDVIELMDYLDIVRAHVVGKSDGGIIGLNLAIRYPDRLLKVVAYGANFHPDGLTDTLLDLMNNVTVDNYGDDRAYDDYLSVAPDPSQFGVMLDKVVSMWLSQPDWTTEDLAQIKTPVLVIDDAQGLSIRPEHVQIMAEAIPGARLKLIDETDHAATKEKPEIFTDLVLGFLEAQ